jgi:hypothetical protein
MAIIFEKLLPNRFFNCSLLPTSKNILAGELPTTQKFLDTPLGETKHFYLKLTESQQLFVSWTQIY